MKEGDYSVELIAIEEGTADVMQGGRTMPRWAPGDLIGEMGLLKRRPRNADVIATSPMRLIKLTHWEIRRMSDTTVARITELIEARRQSGGSPIPPPEAADRPACAPAAAAPAPAPARSSSAVRAAGRYDGDRQRHPGLVLRRRRQRPWRRASSWRARSWPPAPRLIDIGGESGATNRPAVDPGEEIARVVPLIERGSGELGARVSVDTYKPEVAAGGDRRRGLNRQRRQRPARSRARRRLRRRPAPALVLMHTTPPPKQQLPDRHSTADGGRRAGISRRSGSRWRRRAASPSSS